MDCTFAQPCTPHLLSFTIICDGFEYQSRAWDGMANYADEMSTQPQQYSQRGRLSCSPASLGKYGFVLLWGRFSPPLWFVSLLWGAHSHTLTVGGPSGMVSLVTLVFPLQSSFLGLILRAGIGFKTGARYCHAFLICGFHVHIEQLLYRSICNITICNYLYSRVRCVDQRSRPALSPEPQLPISETRSVVRSAAVMVAASLGLGASSSSSEQARETSICLVKEI